MIFSIKKKKGITDLATYQLPCIYYDSIFIHSILIAYKADVFVFADSLQFLYDQISIFADSIFDLI